MTDSQSDFPSEPPPREPVFNLPAILLSVIIFMAILYGLQSLMMGPDAASNFDFIFGFIPARYVYPLFRGDYAWIWSPLTYSFLHGSLEHLLFNCLWLMSFGTPVVRRIGAVRSAVFWVISAAAAAFFYAALHWGEVRLVIGASGVISAFMGAACRFAFPPRMRRVGARPVHLYPLMTLREVLSSRTATSLLILGVVGNVLVAIGLPLTGTDQAIAWEAHVGGLFFGFLAFPLFDRPQTGAEAN